MTRLRARTLGAVLAISALAMTASPAIADPAFGPGNNGGGQGNSGPQVGKCHPPGQTTTTPGCK